jgi:hypothetical protein
MLTSILRLLDLELPVSDHTTFSRRSADLIVAEALSTVGGPVNVVIDTTGLKVFGAGEWQREKHGGKGCRTWRKLNGTVKLMPNGQSWRGRSRQVSPSYYTRAAPVASRHVAKA